jgi:putative transposase
LAHRDSLRQQFIMPHFIAERIIHRLIRTLKEQFLHHHRIETQRHAASVNSDWIQIYNTQRPHQAFRMHRALKRTPDAHKGPNLCRQEKPI